MYTDYREQKCDYGPCYEKVLMEWSKYDCDEKYFCKKTHEILYEGIGWWLVFAILKFIGYALMLVALLHIACAFMAEPVKSLLILIVILLVCKKEQPVCCCNNTKNDEDQCSDD